MRDTDLAWPDYLVALENDFGSEALAVRHEIYFLTQQPHHALKAVAALLRDAWRLMRLPACAHIPENIRVFLVVTLQGPSGWQTLLRAQKYLSEKGIQHVAIAHLRLRFEDATSCAMARPSYTQLLRAVCHGMQFLRGRSGKINSLIVACCLTRHALWQATWQQTMRAIAQPAPVFLLHNDFDMMSRALVAVAADQATIACVQHGIPTDEFFPASAPTQIVWGRSSEKVYRQSGYGGVLIMDALGRGGAVAYHDTVPQNILLLSQSHTPIYGIDLPPLFVELASELVHALPTTHILLHPEEIRGKSPYPPSLATQLQTPPHKQLMRGETPCLVVGYSSTAMLEAALAGHYVVAMYWPAAASREAFHLTRPPIICHSTADIIAYFHELWQSSDSRRRHHQLQQEWVDATYASTGAFATWVEQSLC